jgi:hypothetical protein
MKKSSARKNNMSDVLHERLLGAKFVLKLLTDSECKKICVTEAGSEDLAQFNMGDGCLDGTLGRQHKCLLAAEFKSKLLTVCARMMEACSGLNRGNLAGLYQ